MSACTHAADRTCSLCWCNLCDDWIVNDPYARSPDEHYRDHEDHAREWEEERAYTDSMSDDAWPEGFDAESDGDSDPFP